MSVRLWHCPQTQEFEMRALRSEVAHATSRSGRISKILNRLRVDWVRFFSFKPERGIQATAWQVCSVTTTPGPRLRRCLVIQIRCRDDISCWSVTTLKRLEHSMIPQVTYIYWPCYYLWLQPVSNIMIINRTNEMNRALGHLCAHIG